MNQPNILIMMCDQLNAGVLGCYGGAVPTPKIDRIANEGVLFTNTICSTPFCSPSRASMITGLYPHTHGIVSNVNRRDYPAIPSPETEEGIRNSDITTEKLLHEAGYSTHHYGKWHLLDEDLSYYTDMFGEHHEYKKIMQEYFTKVRSQPRDTWMEWYGWALPVKRSPTYQKAIEALGEKWKSAVYSEFIGKMGKLEIPLEQNFDYMVADKTIETLKSLDNRPFMITCSFNLPHDPNVVPSPYYEMFEPDEIVLPANFDCREQRFESQWSRQVVENLGEVGVREFMRIYYASVKLIDDQVGRVLEALDATGRAENTIVLFTADHGDMCGGHGMVWKSTDAFYEEVARIPFIIRYPQEIAPQQPDMVSNITDVMPTLLDFVEHPIPEHVEGNNLAPFLRRDKQPQEAPPYTFCERLAALPERRRAIEPGRRGSFMVRSREWKYCRYADGEEMLYNLAEDAGEIENLASDPLYRQTVEELREQLNEFKG